MTTFSNLIILPFILRSISQEEYGLWSIFFSIDAGIGLIEMGLGTVVTRYITYAFCGAVDIPMEGLPRLERKKSSNHKLLFNIVYVAKDIYRKITLIALGLFAVASIYIVILSLQLNNPWNAIVGWVIFSCGCLLRTYFTYLNSFMKGIGMIKEMETVGTLLTIIYLLTRLGFVLFGWGLIGLGFASILDAGLGRILIYKSLKGYIKDHEEYASKARKETKAGGNKAIKRVIWKNSKQMGVLTVSDYLTGQGKSLICSTILPLSVTAQFSLTNQLISAVASVSLIPYMTFRVQMGDAIVRHDDEKTKDILAFSLMIFVGLMLTGGIVVIFWGGKAIAFIKSNTFLLENRYVVLLILYSFVMSLNSICTGYIGLTNTQVFVWPTAVSGISGVVLSYLAFSIVGTNALSCYIYAVLASQLVYNAWKWPMYVRSQTGLKLRDIPERGLSYLTRVMQGKN